MNRYLPFIMLLTGLALPRYASGQYDTLKKTKNILGEQLKAKILDNGSSLLYNGVEYQGYPEKYFIEGQPFFGSDTWTEGYIIYEGHSFSHVPILYDLINDEVVIKYFNHVQMLTLIRSKVQRFSINGHNFVLQVPADKASGAKISGFCELLYHDKLTLLVKRTKTIVEKVSIDGVARSVVSKNTFYLLKDGVSYPFDGQASLINLLADKKQELKNFSGQQKLQFKAEPEKAVVAIVAYYDQLRK